MKLDKYKFTKKQSFHIDESITDSRGDYLHKENAVETFANNLREIHMLQQKLYAERKEGVIFIFQAMDAAGKDGAIRTVFSTLSPHGVKEYCFKAPTAEELSHDYLWRFWSALPARGHISIFNRSYYEDVLVGKVHKLYQNQIMPERMVKSDIIKKRYTEINNYEKYLYGTGTRVVKIFLNVSKEEQAKRFISRIDIPRKNWKISENDIKEREFWEEYQQAFEDMVNETSSKHCPWYVVPADCKWFARLVVSEIVLQTLREINPQYPEVSEEQISSVETYRENLVNSLKTQKKQLSKKKKWKEKQDNVVKEMSKLQTEEERQNYIDAMMEKGEYGFFIEEDDKERTSIEGECAFEKPQELSIELAQQKNVLK